MANAKIPFKETEIGKWVTKNVPNAVNVVESFTPAPIKGTIETIKNVINAAEHLSPEQKQEGIALADNYEKLFLDEIGDRKDARAREVSLKDNTPKILAYSVTVGFFGLLSLLIFHVIPTGSETILNVMTGALGTAWISIINYFFGSSAGSAKKSETIDAMMKQ